MLHILFAIMWVAAGAQQPTCIFDCQFEGKVSGTLYMAVFNTETTWGKTTQMHLGKTWPIDQVNQFTCQVDALKPGNYAVAFFLDENGNGKLDTNWMGIPIEAYGYSNGARPKYRAAQWHEVQFYLGAEQKIRQSVSVKKWKF